MVCLRRSCFRYYVRGTTILSALHNNFQVKKNTSFLNLPRSSFSFGSYWVVQNDQRWVED
jgi:hypothetical protein